MRVTISAELKLFSHGVPGRVSTLSFCHDELNGALDMIRAAKMATAFINDDSSALALKAVLVAAFDHVECIRMELEHLAGHEIRDPEKLI